MKKRNFKRYEVDFWDHGIGLQDIRCKTLGYLIEETKLSYKFSFWITDLEDDKDFKDNLETFTILKAAVIKKRVLK